MDLACLMFMRMQRCNTGPMRGGKSKSRCLDPAFLQPVLMLELGLGIQAVSSTTVLAFLDKPFPMPLGIQPISGTQAASSTPTLVAPTPQERLLVQEQVASSVTTPAASTPSTNPSNKRPQTQKARPAYRKGSSANIPPSNPRDPFEVLPPTAGWA